MTLRQTLKQALPTGAFRLLQVVRHPSWYVEMNRTRLIVGGAKSAPAYLPMSDLEALQVRYSPPPEYRYDPSALEARGEQRVAQMMRLPGAAGARSFLELGCGDGMVSCCLVRHGKDVTAIDSRGNGFDERAVAEGVKLLEMDAEHLAFPDETFDYVFSYDSFEHFGSPEKVLREAIRVVKKNGFVFLWFGPLFYSAYGQHIYRTITVPYSQCLFEQSLMSEFIAKRDIAPFDFSQMNGWGVTRFRALWKKYAKTLKPVRYDEKLDISQLALIRAYPSCFKDKSSHFEDFTVASISALFTKVDGRLPEPVADDVASSS